MDPRLKRVYDIIKSNQTTVTKINIDINGPLNAIKNQDFEGVAANAFTSTISQISDGINQLTDASNRIIEKENIFNTQFLAALESYKLNIDALNELDDRLSAKRSQLYSLQAQQAKKETQL